VAVTSLAAGNSTFGLSALLSLPAASPFPAVPLSASAEVLPLLRWSVPPHARASTLGMHLRVIGSRDHHPKSETRSDLAREPRMIDHLPFPVSLSFSSLASLSRITPGCLDG
jgi:hypothetical protein